MDNGLNVVKPHFWFWVLLDELITIRCPSFPNAILSCRITEHVEFMLTGPLSVVLYMTILEGAVSLLC